MIDLTPFGISADMQAMVFQVLAVATLALPALEKVAELTHNTWDNKAVGALRKVLGMVPRVRLGK